MKKVVANRISDPKFLFASVASLSFFASYTASLIHPHQSTVPILGDTSALTTINKSGDMVVFSRTSPEDNTRAYFCGLIGIFLALVGWKVFVLGSYCKKPKEDEPQTQPKRPRSNSDPNDVHPLYDTVEQRAALIAKGASFNPNFQFVNWDDDLLVLKMKTPMGIVHKFGFSSDKSSYPPSLSRVGLTAVEKAGRDFAIENGIYQVGKLKTLLEVTNVPGLVFAKYKSIDKDEAIILSNWIIALFAVDDRFDLVRNGQYTPSDAVKKLAELKTNVLRAISKDRDRGLAEIYNDVKKDDDLRGIPSEVKALANAFKAALTYISTKVKKEKQPSIIRQWISSFESYVNSVGDEKSREERQDYREFYGDAADNIRNEACGGLHAFKLGALLKGVDIDRVEKYANIKIIAKQVCDHVQWFNDLVSYQKEKLEYEKSNDGKLFCKRLAFNKVALLTRKFVKQHDDSSIENGTIIALDEVWKEMEQKAFQQLHADINQKHGYLNGEIKDLIQTIEADQTNPLNSQKIIYLKDLHGWLNGQVPWAAFADRYALSGSISQAVANNRLHNLMFPEKNS